jgi:preprotein translocase subunit YajC
MNPSVLTLIASQVAEAGQFASAVLQRNVAVGAIVLLVCAVVALSWAYVRLVKARTKDQKEHTEVITKLHDDYTVKIQTIHNDHASFDQTKSERIATEMKEKDARGYASLEKVTEVVANVGNELRNLTDVIKERLR